MKRFHLLPIAFCLLFQVSLTAQSQPFLIEVEGKSYTIEERMAAHQVNGIGYVVARNFEIDTTMYAGYRDKENNLKVDNNTLFQMGSMTGALTKFAIIRLVNDGQIDLNAPANLYLKSWQIPEKSFTKNNPITIKDLLTQRRGMNDIYKPEGYLPGLPTPNLLQILNGEEPSNLGPMTPQKDLNKKGDTNMANNMILQQILEDFYEKPFAEIMAEQVFIPLQMDHSLIRAELSKTEKNNAAVGYHENEATRITGDRWVYPELAVAGLWSTPEDYTKFVLHLFKAAKGMDNSLISQALAQASVEPETGYISLIFYKNENQYWGGAPMGFYSQFTGNAEEGWMVMVCTNRHLSWKLVNWELTPRGIDFARNNH